MPIITPKHVERLIALESRVHYADPPAQGDPFELEASSTPVILSAPHGAITFRDADGEIWHDEDEYTAGMACLLAELCGASFIATTWKTVDSDPNHHDEAGSPYKRALRDLIESTGARWVIDLHGAGENSERLGQAQLVDLGAGRRNDYLPAGAYARLVACLEGQLGPGAADRDGNKGFPASGRNRIAAYASRFEGVHAVQIEMKPSVRVALRRPESSAFRKDSLNAAYAAPTGNVCKMLQALTDFIEALKER